MRRSAVGALVALSLTACGGAHRTRTTSAQLTAAAASAPTTTVTTATTSSRPARHRRSHLAPRRATHHGARPARPSPPAPHATHRSHRPAHTTTTQPKASITYAISILLHGGGSLHARACGAAHHFRTYATGAPVRVTGTVRPIPTGSWKVKIKIKVCHGGSFGDFIRLDASRDKHHGTFSGSFPAPAPGDYEARAELYVSDTRVARTEEKHIATL